MEVRESLAEVLEPGLDCRCHGGVHRKNLDGLQRQCLWSRQARRGLERLEKRGDVWVHKG